MLQREQRMSENPFPCHSLDCFPESCVQHRGLKMLKAGYSESAPRVLPECSSTYRTLCCFLKRPLPSKVSTQSSTGSESGFEKTTWMVRG